MNVEVRKLISSIEKGTVPTGYKKTKLGIIPDEWEISTLGEVSTFKNGKAHEQNVSEDGRFIIVNSKFISTEGNEFKRSNTEICPLKKGDITMVMSDVPNGKALAKCFFIDRDNVYTLNQRICSITVNRKNMDEIFLYYYINRNNYFLRFDNGVGQTNLRKDEVLNCPVIKPPIQEQQKIASILSTWDKAIELKEKLIEQKKEQKKGLMQKLLTGEVRLPGFKGKWEKVYLKDVVIGKGKYGINAPSVEKSSELPTYLRITDISDEGYVHTNGLQSVNHPNSNDYFLEKNDIVFARTGASTGRTYLYDNSDGKLVYAGFLIKYSIDTNKAVPKYIKFCTQTEEYHNWVGVMSMRSGQPGINAEEYGQLPINLPPIKEQLEISNILSYLEREILLLESEREMITNQKNGLMQLLLTGKVRVKV